MERWYLTRNLTHLVEVETSEFVVIGRETGVGGYLSKRDIRVM